MHTKDKTFVSLSDDLLFKEALTHIDNRDKLIYFLSCFTDFSFDYLKQVNMRVLYESILSKTRLNDKGLRSDVIIEFDNYKINLECYSKFNEESFDKSVNYIMRIFSTQLDRGKDYNLLESIIQINLIDNITYKFNENVINEYGIVNIKDLEDHPLANKFTLKFFRIDKAREIPYNKSDLTIRWLKFIGAKSQEERSSIAKGDELLMELDNWVEEYVNDERTKEIFGKWAEEIAKKKGIEEGKEEIVKKMLQDNCDISLISKYTGLSIQKINELK